MEVVFDLDEEGRRRKVRGAGKVKWYLPDSFLKNIETTFRFSDISLKNLLIGGRSLATVASFFRLFLLIRESSGAGGWTAEEELNKSMQAIAKKHFKQSI